MGVPHFLAIPYPVQGHVNPLMQFSHAVSKHGCKVTFLNTEFSHKRAKHDDDDNNNSNKSIKFVTLPDGLEPEDERSDQMRVLLSIKNTMPSLLPKLIEEINAFDAENKITCIVVTFNMGWALEVGHKLGIKGAFLYPGSATTLASSYCIPRLIHDGIIDSDGNTIKEQQIALSPNIPMMDTTHFPWSTLGKIFFPHLVKEMETMKLGEWWLCNTAYDLEPGPFSMSPKFLPIGPLMGSGDTNKYSFWQEDTTCIKWLDQQTPKSVIYVSFGSLAVMESNQFKELALALDQINKPFLWVVRPSKNDNNSTYPEEFHGSKGKIVGWAPQKKILDHPAVACFISHCGWNSTVEGVYCGVPFLCWPFFSDQFLDKAYICDEWKVGLGLDKDGNGFVSKEEIRNKVEQLLGDEGIRERSLKLKEVTRNNVREGGQSSNNLQKFMNWAK